MGYHDLAKLNRSFVSRMIEHKAGDETLKQAIGGQFDAYGKIEVALLRKLGLTKDQYLIDVGCGSGRLAIPLSKEHDGKYLGTDLVPALIKHARANVVQQDWRFEVISHIGIPEQDDVADMVCFFSVLTHLLHEQSYWYLEEAKRVLKPGGRIVFTFLEFSDPKHSHIFWWSLQEAKNKGGAPLNVFIGRDAIEFWAEALDMVIEQIHSGSEQLINEGATGQAVCVLRKRI